MKVNKYESAIGFSDPLKLKVGTFTINCALNGSGLFPVIDRCLRNGHRVSFRANVDGRSRHSLSYLPKYPFQEFWRAEFQEFDEALYWVLLVESV